MNAGDDQERSGGLSIAMNETELPDQHTVLRAFWEELDVPHGWRTEIVKGSVVVTPPPANRHAIVAALLHEQSVLAERQGWGVHQTQAIEFAPTGDIYVPDLLIYPREEMPEDGYTAPAEHALFVVEITALSNPDYYRKRKLWGYAHGQVPLYLLIDAHASDGPHVTLYSLLENGVYQSMTRVPYGEVITLPEPFELKIDTGQFPRP